MQSYIERTIRLVNLWNIYSNGISIDEIYLSNKNILSESAILYTYDLNTTFKPNDIDIFTALDKETFEKINFIELGNF